MGKSITIIINNNHFELHQQGALFWKEQSMLLIADVHLGKIAHFRKNGMAIPIDGIEINFKNLTLIVEKFNPYQICFLGDLFHSKLNKEWILFENWVKSTNKKIILIEGNHDIISKQKYADLSILIYKELKIDGFKLTHHPEDEADFFNFCGHVHPGIKLKGIAKQYLKLACFYKTNNQMILPAFGEFTGNYYLPILPEIEIFVLNKDEVIKI